MLGDEELAGYRSEALDVMERTRINMRIR